MNASTYREVFVKIMSDHPKGSSQKKPNVFRSSRWTSDHGEKKLSNRTHSRPLQDSGPCKIHSLCRTCTFINDDLGQSLESKTQKGLDILRQKGLMKTTQVVKAKPSPRQLEYRTHAKMAIRPYSLAVRPTSSKASKRFAIGLFQPESHKLVDIERCPLHRESIDRFVKELRVELENSTIQPYDEKLHQGDLRYLAIRASHLTQELMVTFVVRDPSVRLALKALAMKLRQLGHQMSSVYMNVNEQPSNVIFGPQNIRLIGSDRLREELCGLSFEIGPTSFFQVNPWQAEQIYHRIGQLAGQAPGQAVAWDLFCGIGQISLVLSQVGYQVLGIEENPQAIRDAQRNAVRNELDHQPSFMTGRVEQNIDQLPDWAQQPKLIVVNPSRRGLAPEVREFLRDRLAADKELRLIYLSCEVETLARDLEEITSGGRQLRQIEPFDMFPGTEKMEWLAIVD